jgi:hypothetical protein
MCEPRYFSEADGYLGGSRLGVVDRVGRELLNSRVPS